jgi:hypothetical protein
MKTTRDADAGRSGDGGFAGGRRCSGAEHQPGQPAEQQDIPVEPSGEQAADEHRAYLQDPDAAEWLQLDGERNSATAEPKSSWVLPVAFAVGMNAPKGFFVAGLIAAKWVCAVPKMWP